MGRDKGKGRREGEGERQRLRERELLHMLEEAKREPHMRKGKGDRSKGRGSYPIC